MIDARLPVRAFFTDRYGGVSAAPFAELNVAEHVGDDPSAVDINRGIIDDMAGAPVVFMRPEHGARVAVIGSEYLDGRDPPEADVLITDVQGLGLAALAADCVPLLIHDGLSGVVAAAHVGREGLRKGTVDAAIAALLDVRKGWRRPDLVTVSIGPSMCGHCYEVSAATRDQVARFHPTATATTRWGTPSLDLSRAVAARFVEVGFTNVFRHRYCTYEDLSLYSYRREGQTGRQAGVVVCEGPSR